MVLLIDPKDSDATSTLRYGPANMLAAALDLGHGDRDAAIIAACRRGNPTMVAAIIRDSGPRLSIVEAMRSTSHADVERRSQPTLFDMLAFTFADLLAVVRSSADTPAWRSASPEALTAFEADVDAAIADHVAATGELAVLAAEAARKGG